MGGASLELRCVENIAKRMIVTKRIGESEWVAALTNRTASILISLARWRGYQLPPATVLSSSKHEHNWCHPYIIAVSGGRGLEDMFT